MADVGRPPLVTFLSDFGTEDAFVGLCHAAVLAECPDARVIDLSHAVAPQDVLQGAARLADAVEWVPAPAVHLAVVDPGVGTERRAVALACGSAFLVGPDNGLLLPAAEALGGVDGAWRLPVPEMASATFHGRDLFAPAAGRLAAGAAPDRLGVGIDPHGLVATRMPTPSLAGGGVDAPVRDLDRYGNLQLAVRPAELERAGIVPGAELTVRVGGQRRPARLARTFGELAPGSLGVIEDSFGWAAVVRAGGSAADLLGAWLQDRVTIEVSVSAGGAGA